MVVSLSDPRLESQAIFFLLPPLHRTRINPHHFRTKHFVSLLVESKKNPTRISCLATGNPSSSAPIRPDLRNPLLDVEAEREPTRRKNKKTKNLLQQRIVGGQEQMWLLCVIGYWMSGFRCFPWLALNFHMANGLGLGPNMLQLVQTTGNLPIVAKPIYGVLSDALYIGAFHRVPYISFGVLLQMVSWGTLALMPLTRSTFSTQILCIMLGNLGASFTEVVSDAVVAEFSKISLKKTSLFQSYSFMALAAGGILGNFTAGFFLLKSQEPKLMFLAFALFLALQFALSLTTREDTTREDNRISDWSSSVSEKLTNQLSDMFSLMSDATVSRAFGWIVVSIATVPLLSGTMFCFQTQCLGLNPNIIGLSKAIGQIFFLSATFMYNRYSKHVPLRNLIFAVQTIYALSLLSELLLVKQINIALGVSNEVHVLCLSALAEATAQFKILPFTVLLAGLCPAGCEGSLFAFFASAVCLASIISNFLGVGLASVIGLSSGSYSALPLGIVLQAVAALLPLLWISYVPSPTRRTF